MQAWTTLTLVAVAMMPLGGSLGGEDSDLVALEVDHGEEDSGEGYEATPMDTIVWLLGSHLSREVRQALDDLGDELPPVVVPARPTEIAVDVELRAQVKLETDSSHSHANASAHASSGNVSMVGHGGEEAWAQIPCRDPRGCPDMVVDPSMFLVGGLSTESFSPDHCAVEEGATEPGERRLLRFTFTAPNIGDGDLVIGQPHNQPQWFEWGECHGHWHFRDFAEYRLWEPGTYLKWAQLRTGNPEKTAGSLLQDHPELQDGLISGHKQGFCLIDLRPYTPFQPPRFLSCVGNQGVSRGWADEYGHHLDGQWVDVTGVPAGLYVLEAEVNPGRIYMEMDYTNNAAAVPVAIPPQGV